MKMSKALDPFMENKLFGKPTLRKGNSLFGSGECESDT